LFDFGKTSTPTSTPYFSENKQPQVLTFSKPPNCSKPTNRPIRNTHNKIYYKPNITKEKNQINRQTSTSTNNDLLTTFPTKNNFSAKHSNHIKGHNQRNFLPVETYRPNLPTKQKKFLVQKQAQVRTCKLQRSSTDNPTPLISSWDLISPPKPVADTSPLENVHLLHEHDPVLLTNSNQDSFYTNSQELDLVNIDD
jgi:hypothetical protein